jgi:CubicO group peptidase (beta-lactamase class C family)
MMKQQIISRFPGISCACMDATGKETTEYYGVSDKEKNIAVDNDTIFPACSMSKFVTAICLMKLHERKVIDIDASVNDYLQPWKLLTMDGCESDATIRALMCHTAGITDGEDAFYGLRRGEPEISLMDILEGKTSYNNRPVRAEKPQGTAFEYSDSGYCVLQLLVQETVNKAFEDAVQEIVFDQLQLKNTFFASPKNLEYFEKHKTLATGYDGDGLPLPGRFPPCPDLAGAGLWSTPKELLAIAKEFVAAFNGESDFLQEKSAREIAKPVDQFPWTGLGVFVNGEDTLMTQGWGENGQCMMKMNCRTGEISVVMTNRNPEMSQAESGVEWLVNQNLIMF